MTRPPASLIRTRTAWHAVAELLVAGPQYAAAGDIRLAVAPSGFTGWTDRNVAVDGTVLVTPAGRFPITGSIAELAAAAGIQPRRLDDVYRDVVAVGLDEPIEVDGAAAAELGAAFGAGDAALRAVAPDAERVLWPEHFDVGVTVDQVNYGVSPGDDHIPEPYAYVGPWNLATLPPDPFWNHSFGAAVPVAELAGAEEIAAFFRRGRDLAGAH